MSAVKIFGSLCANHALYLGGNDHLDLCHDHHDRGVARHEGQDNWTLLRMWRADRAKEIWIEMDPSGFEAEPATASCEVGAGDGSLP